MIMEGFKISNESGLELTVSNVHPDNECVIMGGMSHNPTWEEYLIGYKKEFIPHMELIKKAIEELDLIGETAQDYSDGTCFVFSDEIAIGFTWRAWGDLMQAIVGKREGYMKYYM